MNAPKPERGRRFIEGDHEVPANTTVEEDVFVTGTLRLGDGCTFKGNVHGGEAVIFGKQVMVDGNITSRGPILLGPNHYVEGDINPDIDDRLHEEVRRTWRHPTGDHETVLLRAAIHETVAALLELAWDAHGSGQDGFPESWWGLDWAATHEVVQGLFSMIDDAYAGTWHGEARPAEAPEDETQAPRSTDAEWTIEVLLKRVLPDVIPVRIERRGPNEAILGIGRPDRRWSADAPTRGWPWPTVALINTLGYAADPTFRVVLIGDESLKDADADPDRVQVRVTFAQDQRARTPQT